MGGPGTLALAFVALTVWGWRRWPDLLVDFGHELYVPWQLSLGRTLYRDLAFLYGPLSQYLNASVFRVFGVSLTVLMIANLAILAGITALLYVLVSRTCDRLTATVCGLVLLVVFGFSQFTSIGNYNFICPYSHEATHGTALALAMIFFLAQQARRPTSSYSAALAGVCFGLTLLTRAEVAVAALGAAGVGLTLALLSRDPEQRRPVATVAWFAGAALLPGAVAFQLFWLRMPAAQAAAAVGGAWLPLLRSDVTRSAFFMSGMGLDEPAANLLRMAVAAVWLLGITAALAGTDLLFTRLHIAGRGGAAFVAVAIVGLLNLAMPGLIPWREVGRVLPLTAGLAAVAAVIAALRHRTTEKAGTFVPMAAFSTFALILLGKMLLKAHLLHYGFYLAMPATVALVATLLHVMPAVLRRRWSGGAVFRAGAAALIATALAFHLGWSRHFYAIKTSAVGSDGDTILEYQSWFVQRSDAVRRALRLIGDTTTPDQTLVALPEGIMLNYLARRANPTPFTTFMPTELTVYGEPTILASLRAHPPDLIALVHKETREFGVGFFGKDPHYGMQIMDWINERYATVEVIQSEPLVSTAFGIKIMKKRP